MGMRNVKAGQLIAGAKYPSFSGNAGRAAAATACSFYSKPAERSGIDKYNQRLGDDDDDKSAGRLHKL